MLRLKFITIFNILPNIEGGREFTFYNTYPTLPKNVRLDFEPKYP